ncbi:MAG: DUF2339 domain-containing protein [Desulfobacterales bacterium]|nr:DUF2339 domain-containing protein [Desulfobacterales bacterium]MBF0395495.1 DUF2339 domain-containing protein [Desulfobacterales bacterium]
MPSNTIIFMILSAIIWAILNDNRHGLGVFLAGAFIGYLLSVVQNLKGQIKSLEKSFLNLEKKINIPQTPSPKEEEKKETPVVKHEVQVPKPLDLEIKKPQPSYSTSQKQVKEPLYEKIPGFFNMISRFFTEGNVVAKVGLIILFFGVSFLVKYAAAHSMVPVEFRFIGAALIGIIMLTLGWRLRNRKRNYALLIQGGAVGILYITVFAAAKIYSLIPLPITFGILVLLSGFSSVIAVLQDAQIIAAFGISGGFLAPVLTSSGSGSHVTLFTYYLILNAGIFGISWYKAWRPLNLLGFVFTLGIGSAWGIKNYQSVYFASTEPFLIIFFLFYVTISVLFSLRQPIDLKGYVDGSLVFGLPITLFSLQYSLVQDIKYGLAFSAISISIFYVSLATFLWNRNNQNMRMLVESFLALGVVFGSLAIPLALDGKWTASAWAMEGAALVWVGVRQNRIQSRIFGFILQFGASIAFLFSLGFHGHSPSIPIFNGFCLGKIVISFSYLFTSYYLQRNSKLIKNWEEIFNVIFFISGVLWWVYAGFNEIDLFVPYSYRLNSAVMFIAFSTLIFNLIEKNMDWKNVTILLYLYLPALCVFVLNSFEHGQHPFKNLGYISWIFAIIVFYYNLWNMEKKWEGIYSHIQHWSGLSLVVFLLTWQISWSYPYLIQGSKTWSFIMWGLIPSVFIVLIIIKGESLPWPFKSDISGYQSYGLAPLVFFVSIWCLYGSITKDGDPSPLSYIPILNPLEMSIAFAFIALFLWHLIVKNKTFLIIYFSLIFIMLNSMLARAVHYFGKVPYIWDSLFDSMIYQSLLSIFWSFSAMAIMTIASRKKIRTAWMVGACLIAAIVIKLFLKDLSGSGTITRIISFICVGGVMLLIGYISPLPPNISKILAIILFLGINNPFPVQSAGPAPSDFAYGLILKTDDTSSPFYEFTLPKEVYEKITRKDLRDLMVFNKEGQQLPYSIQPLKIAQKIEKKTVELPFFPLTMEKEESNLSVQVKTDLNGAIVNINQTNKDNISSNKISAYLIDLSSLKDKPSALEFDWLKENTGFITYVNIKGSNNLNNWHYLVNGACIADLYYGNNRLIRKEINLGVQFFKYLHLSSIEEKELNNLTAIRGSWLDKTSEQDYRWQSINAIEALSKSSDYFFELSGFFPINSVKIKLPEQNTVVNAELSSRFKETDNWTFQFRGVIYSLKMKNEILTNEPITIPFNTTDRYWRLSIDKNSSGIGPGIPALEFGWIAHKLTFVARGDPPFIIAFGSAKIESHIQQIDDLLQKMGNIKKINSYDLIELSGNKALKALPKPIEWRKFSLWFILISSVIGMGWMSWRLYKQMNIKGEKNG